MVETKGVQVGLRGSRACHMCWGGDPAPSPTLYQPRGPAKPLNRVGVAHGMRGWGARGPQWGGVLAFG